MLYDSGVLTVCRLTEAGAPDKRTLEPVCQHWYGERVVGVTRMYAAKQASCKIDMLLEIWQDRTVMPDMYCIPEDGQQYRITDVQHTQDDYGILISVLTLERLGRHYELGQAAGN